MKIKDLYLGDIPAASEKKARLLLDAGDLPMVPSNALPPPPPCRPTAPEWCRASEEDVRTGTEVAMAAAKLMRGMAAKRAAFNVVWRSNGRPAPLRSDVLAAAADSIGMGLFHVALFDSQSCRVAGEGWLKRPQDPVAGGRALAPGRTLVVYEEEECRLGKIVTKFDVA
jgi:hypothetical protein